MRPASNASPNAESARASRECNPSPASAAAILLIMNRCWRRCSSRASPWSDHRLTTDHALSRSSPHLTHQVRASRPRASALRPTRALPPDYGLRFGLVVVAGWGEAVRSVPRTRVAGGRAVDADARVEPAEPAGPAGQREPTDPGHGIERDVAVGIIVARAVDVEMADQVVAL